MDAGVPSPTPVAGISVGRFTDENGGNEVFVTDIIGEEDFFGDMDFKVSGTRDGITGIQLDLKARGLWSSRSRRSSSRPRGPPRDHRAMESSSPSRARRSRSTPRASSPSRSTPRRSAS
jgi:hypothetical protein